MNSIWDLLNVNRDIFTNFSLQGHDIENNIELDRILKKVTRKLKSIEEEMQSNSLRPNFNQKSINEIIEKVKEDAAGFKQSWSIKELRIMTYYMMRFQNNQSLFDYALNLLETNWKDLYINGLMFFLMTSWNTCPNDMRKSVSEMLKHHLNGYGGSIKRYQIIKKQTDLLDSAGPVRLASLTQARGMALEEAPTLLGYKQTSISFPYFSDMIINYFRKKKIEFEELEHILKKHILDRTRKLIYAHLVEQAENSCDGNLQGAVARSARRILGDINLSITWAPFNGATVEEERQLCRAKDLIVAWGARKTVDAFFDICVQDSRRRKYWLEYIGNIMDYRIVGSTSIRTKLMSNSEVAPLLKTCFIKTNSRVSSTAALILFIKNKVFVEFSDVGSLYIYNNTNHVVKDIKKMRCINSTADLKDISIGRAMEQFNLWSYYDEGYISHRGEWEERFRSWMRNQMSIEPGTEVKYSNMLETSQNKIIKSIREEDAKPIPQDITTNLGKSKQLDSEQNIFPNDACVTILKNKEEICYPGTRVYPEIQGLQSEWIFNDICKILADKDGTYIYIKKNKRTYYVAPSLLTKYNGIDIFIGPNYSSQEKYNIYLAILNIESGVTYTKTMGTIEQSGFDIIYTPVNGNKVNIHTQ